MSLLSIAGLAKRFGSVAAVDGIDLDLAPGTRTAIVGPSGCGKTTLLRLIAGFDAPSAGKIVMDGRILAGEGAPCPAHRRGIGVVSQDGSLFPHLTIAENIGFGIPRREDGRAKRVAELAYTVGLDASILPRRPHQLSGGQQQRVALARAMALKPRLMLLDEPFSALDTGLRVSMRKTVAEVLGSAGITTILVTHDQTEALSFADQLAVMQDGRFAQVGAPRDLYFRPVNAMVAHFLGDALVLPARIADGYAVCSLGSLTAPGTAPSGQARVMLRPEQVQLEKATTERAAAEALWPEGVFGIVTDLDFAGPSCAVTLRILNTPGTPAAAIGNAPLLLHRPSTDALEKDSVVKITTVGAAHILS